MCKFNYELSNLLERDVWQYIIDAFSIITPIIISVFGFIYSKRQDKKILKDNKINRLANFQSYIIPAKSSNIVLYLKTYHNYSLLKTFENVLLSEKGEVIDGLAYGFKFELNFENLTNVFPNTILIKEIRIWDNTIDKKLQNVTKQLQLVFKNKFNEYKNITIGKEKNVIVPILCCLDKEEYDKLANYDSEGKRFTINTSLIVKNSFGLMNECNMRGIFELKEKSDVGTKNLGGQREKWDLELKDTYLNVLKVYEEGDI